MPVWVDMFTAMRYIKIHTADGMIHLTPIDLWRNFADGALPLDSIEDAELMLRVIVAEWLDGPKEYKGG